MLRPLFKKGRGARAKARDKSHSAKPTPKFPSWPIGSRVDLSRARAPTPSSVVRAELVEVRSRYPSSCSCPGLARGIDLGSLTDSAPAWPRQAATPTRCHSVEHVAGTPVSSAPPSANPRRRWRGSSPPPPPPHGGTGTPASSCSRAPRAGTRLVLTTRCSS